MLGATRDIPIFISVFSLTDIVYFLKYSFKLR